jgi:putative flippase GtrA
VRGLYARFEQLFRELAKFGIIGAIAFVTDVTVYNVLRLGALEDKPTWAKIISSLVAMAVAFLGNRFWTYRHRERTGYARETTLFVIFNLIGIVIALLCQAFTHYVLGLDSLLADNISANGVGLVLGTAFRFWTYRRFVFPHSPQLGAVAVDPYTPVDESEEPDVPDADVPEADEASGR